MKRLGFGVAAAGLLMTSVVSMAQDTGGYPDMRGQWSPTGPGSPGDYWITLSRFALTGSPTRVVTVRASTRSTRPRWSEQRGHYDHRN